MGVHRCHERMDMATIAKLPGRASVETTAHHVHLSDRSVADGAARVTDGVGKPNFTYYIPVASCAAGAATQAPGSEKGTPFPPTACPRTVSDKQCASTALSGVILYLLIKVGETAS